nr:hypothetical protein [Clostridium kluyveri]
MDAQLGYDKCNVTEKQTPNIRNGYSKKTIKSELGSVEQYIPGTLSPGPLRFITY